MRKLQKFFKLDSKIAVMPKYCVEYGFGENKLNININKRIK